MTELTNEEIGALWERTTGTHESECPWDVIGFAHAIRNAEIDSLRKSLSEALLDAERAREERNREHVRLNAEWMAKCEELRKDAERYKWLRDNGDLSVRDVFGSWCRQLNDGLDAAIDAALSKKEGA